MLSDPSFFFEVTDAAEILSIKSSAAVIAIDYSPDGV